jgi:hypothetical protein
MATDVARNKQVGQSGEKTTLDPRQSAVKPLIFPKIAKSSPYLDLLIKVAGMPFASWRST